MTMSGENGDGNNDNGGGSDGGEVISLEEARKKAAGAKPDEAAAAPQAVDASGLLQPIVAAIAMELSKVADSDGTVRLGGEDAASKEKTAAVLRGIGAGLGAVLGDAFSKWAEKMVTAGNVKVDATNVPATPAPQTPPSDGGDPEKNN